MSRLATAIIGALLINLALLLVVSMLAQEREVEKNENFSSAIRLVSLTPPEISDPEPEQEPEKPKEEKHKEQTKQKDTTSQKEGHQHSSVPGTKQ